MAIKMTEGPVPEWTADDWSRYLAEVEKRKALGEGIVFDDGLESLRGQVAEVRGEVAELEQLWLRD